ncbi:type II secretion system GspH family protein [Desulfobotulus sp. H1]|uniref:Type II secretion system GspH family protein n=1 Tax=Desulfobotulus pelophilus TaxID=2823377 RepID=A0ABT3NAI6_9BACT|nr:type II secretion system protein [Desulfobotulus pelophilus]MCW7754473.1 type II secretion system GspH family protein [Desulfobotulus pelophilus]
MRMIKRALLPFHKEGFTLIEVIVSLILVSIVGTMLVTFMGTAVTRSADPLLNVQHGHYLNQIMENITADYKILMTENTEPLTELQNRIDSNQYSVEEHPYAVIENKRIRFDKNAETEDSGGKVLKVTLSYRGLTLTALFTE